MPCKCGKVINSKKNTIVTTKQALNNVKIVPKAVPSCDDDCPPLTCCECPTTCKEYNIGVDISYDYISLGSVIPKGGSVPTFSLSLELLSPNIFRFYYNQDKFPPFYLTDNGIFYGYEFEFQQSINATNIFSKCGICLRDNLEEGDIQYFSLEKTMDLLVPNVRDSFEELEYKDNLRNRLIYFFLNIEKNYLKYYRGKKTCNNSFVPWNGYFKLLNRVEADNVSFSTNTINLYELIIGGVYTFVIEPDKNFKSNDKIFFFALINVYFEGDVIFYEPATGLIEVLVVEKKGVNPFDPDSNIYSFWFVNNSNVYNGTFQTLNSSSVYLNQSLQTSFYKDIFLLTTNNPVNVKQIFRNMCFKRYQCQLKYEQEGNFYYPPPFQNVLLNPFIEPTSDPTNNFFRIMNMISGLMNYLFTISENYLLGKDTGIPKKYLDQYLSYNRARYYYNTYFETLIQRDNILGFGGSLNISNGSGTYIKIPGLPDNNSFYPDP